MNTAKQDGVEVGVSLLLKWNPVPETLPPDPNGGWFSPLVWLALSDGRVLMGTALHKSKDAEYDAPVHDWFAIDPVKGCSQSLACFGEGLSVVAWMPFAVPDHPHKGESETRYLNGGTA